jgi:oligopeptide transport system substrate-binding protein
VRIGCGRTVGRAVLFVVLCALMLSASAQWNNPYPASDRGKNVLYSAFTERPKHLDPARAYSANEYDFIAQIYEAPFQYHYLKRPYTLVPLTAQAIPKPAYYDAAGRRLPDDVDARHVAYSVYEIHIRPGIYYQPHPALARKRDGSPRYYPLSSAELNRLDTLGELKETGTRELVAADYVYEIKRLAHPALHSPIFGLMSNYIVGLKDYARTLQAALAEARKHDGAQTTYLDLQRYPLAGAQEVDRYTYRIKIRGKYPQFLYWMAMPFFAPMPPEADRFFSQPGMAEKNLTLDWYAIGTGPYMLTVNNPNLQMVLERNPNFHVETYPSEGEPGDAAQGVLADAGKRLPFIDKVVFSLEKESIPYWNKFLQGYYDRSGLTAESFDQAIRLGGTGEVGLSDDMQKRGIRLQTTVASSIYYYGFNMLDPVVGGYTERARKLRQAISIAIDIEEQIAIFRNGRGIPAQGPIPPGIFGYVGGRAGVNPYVYDWLNGHPERKSIDTARRLLAEAGYPDGRDATTGRPLLLFFDTAAAGPEDRANLEWMRKQFQKLNIELVVRATDYNRFQDKMRRGNAQIFGWGWNADYPDPENFLFLLYGPNKKVESDGENAVNYDNPEFNRLFERMQNMDNGPERARLIEQMIDIVRRDAPWVWGFHPKQFVLSQGWYHNSKPNLMANNTLKYVRLDAAERERLREQWNKPVLWPLAIFGVVLIAATLPAVMIYVRRERRRIR